MRSRLLRVLVVNRRLLKRGDLLIEGGGGSGARRLDQRSGDIAHDWGRRCDHDELENE